MVPQAVPRSRRWGWTDAGTESPASTRGARPARGHPYPNSSPGGPAPEVRRPMAAPTPAERWWRPFTEAKSAATKPNPRPGSCRTKSPHSLCRIRTRSGPALRRVFGYYRLCYEQQLVAILSWRATGWLASLNPQAISCARSTSSPRTSPHRCPPASRATAPARRLRRTSRHVRGRVALLALSAGQPSRHRSPQGPCSPAPHSGSGGAA